MSTKLGKLEEPLENRAVEYQGAVIRADVTSLVPGMGASPKAPAVQSAGKLPHPVGAAGSATVSSADTQGTTDPHLPLLSGTQLKAHEATIYLYCWACAQVASGQMTP